MGLENFAVQFKLELPGFTVHIPSDKPDGTSTVHLYEFSPDLPLQVVVRTSGKVTATWAKTYAGPSVVGIGGTIEDAVVKFAASFDSAWMRFQDRPGRVADPSDRALFDAMCGTLSDFRVQGSDDS